jgi:hypothetical protein
LMFTLPLQGRVRVEIDPILLWRLTDHQASCLLISQDRSFVRTVRTGSE